MAEKRPSPEQFLQRAHEEEKQAGGGKLKIYLGAAPGVGKTYMMLKDAKIKRFQGLDVVVGIVESHGRQEINDLLAGFDILHRQTINYRGKEITEFDLDTALKRRPALILVDEMAHTNAPNLRHTKRWQDIKELLDRGIDVYTTLNVQHIESLNDVVAQIIHAPIKETIPDFMLELAETIELVDLPPEDLLKRLQEGKVYYPKQAEIAVENFFRKGNLIALRELALRATAERVGAQVLLYRQGQGIKHVWPTSEKILVCVGPRTETTKLIRTARRMATYSKTQWLAVYVETPRAQLSKEQRNNAIQNLWLAEQLGAETQILTGFNAVEEIMNYAREQNITQMIVGKRIRPRWQDILFGSFADELVRKSGEIDVYIISEQKPSPATPSLRPTKDKFPWRVYGIAVIITAIATAINLLLAPYMHASNIIMVYLLGVTFVALFGQIGPSTFSSILSVIAYGFLFIPPYFTFAIAELQYVFTLIVMLVVAQVISHLTIITRRQAETAYLSQQKTATLHSLSRQLASTRGVDKLLEGGVQFVSEVFKSNALVLLPEDNHLQIKASFASEEKLDSKEQGVAQWVYDLGQVAGLGTDTLPFSNAIYLPLLASKGTIGVLRVCPLQQTQLFTPEQIHLLEACANQIALAIEVDRLQEQSTKSEFQDTANQMHNIMIKTVAHDLRSPLIAVMGAASTLIEMSGELNSQTVKKLGNTIFTEAEQESRLINNLLQISYFETEKVNLQKEPYSIADEINTTLKTLSKSLGKRPVQLHIQDNLPLVPFDHLLIDDVLSNLIDNAIKFTPPDSAIEISAVIKNDKLLVSIEDHGPGIVPDEVNKLFEKFYRGRMLTSQRGLGLGLALCWHIIDAHGGDIWAETREEGGAAFRFTLPLT